MNSIFLQDYFLDYVYTSVFFLQREGSYLSNNRNLDPSANLYILPSDKKYRILPKIPISARIPTGAVLHLYTCYFGPSLVCCNY